MEKNEDNAADRRALEILQKAANRIHHPSLGQKVQRDLEDLGRILDCPELEIGSSEILRMAGDLVMAGLDASSDHRWDGLGQVEVETRIGIDWILKSLEDEVPQSSHGVPRLRLVK